VGHLVCAPPPNHGASRNSEGITYEPTQKLFAHSANQGNTGRQSALRKQREQLDARLKAAQAAKKKKTANGMNGAKLLPALSFWSM
jgi:hypothetical protein